MADDEVRSGEGRNQPANTASRRWLVWAGALLLAFLLGLLPMWWAKMGVDYKLEQAIRELKRNGLQGSLSAAAVYSRRGEYETARQNASGFFTDVQAELDNANSSVLSAAEKTQMPAILGARDDIITLLSRGDPASGERLSDLYVEYRAATAAPSVPQ